MGFRFRPHVRVGGARVNFGKRGITSVSVGRRGAAINIGRRGIRNTFGVPGSGLSYSTRPFGCCLPTALFLAVAPVVGSWLLIKKIR